MATRRLTRAESAAQTRRRLVAAAVQRRPRSPQRIESHAILSEPWLPGDEFTETLKLRRGRILVKHSTAVDELYTS